MVCAPVAVAIGVAACGGSSVPSGDVASVAGNPISSRAFDHWMFVAAKSNATQSGQTSVIVPNDPPDFKNCIKQVREQLPSLASTKDATLKADCGQLFNELSSQVMDFLIKAYWYQALAHKLGIHVTDAQVQKAFEQAKKTQFTSADQYKAFLTETGQTNADILFRVRVNKVYNDLLKRNTKPVNATTIADYYNSHKSEFSTPESRNLRIVRTNNQAKAAAALAALKSGQSWQTVAKNYSVDATTKSNGGQLMDVTNGEEEQALNKVAFTAPVSQIKGPVHGTFGWYVVEVTKINPATTQPLSKAKPTIKQLLTSQNGTTADTTVNNQSKKAWGSQTLCAAGFEMADCHGYKPKATTTTPVSPTPTPTTTAAPTSSTPTGTSSTSTTHH
jgi:parvulin-like peptidyl-prolyl isomerase